MISIVPTRESPTTTNSKSIERRVSPIRADKDTAAKPAVERPSGSFDLFANARRIYARARIAQRSRASHII
jgi:hypothetical protein